MTSKTLRIIPLGGLGEIGKNMMAVEYGENILVIDAGIMFPENDMLGIDYIIPDFSYLRERRDIVRAVIVTHGHEDHTGAIRHLMEHIDAPIYATRLTLGLLEVKLRRGGLLEKIALNTIEAGDSLSIGPFDLEFFHVCHSIPDGIGLGITTPAGLIVHSGDYKFDHTPVDGWPTDFGKLAEFGQRGVLALLADSTNSDQPGWTVSEATLDGAFDDVFRAASGRILIGTFASLISRIQQVANAAQRHHRVMSFVGTSMVENTRMARKLGYLDIPADIIVPIDQALAMDPSRVVIMCTGTQGEPMSILGRLSSGVYHGFDVESGDTVILSSAPIPGNEEMIHRTINRLFQRGADVHYEPIAPTHVSGHASMEEMKFLLQLVKPAYLIPIHGELRHLKQHAKLAEEIGMSPEQVAVVENGTVVEFKHNKLSIADRIPGGYIFVDGSSVGDVGPTVIRERELLARDGVVAVHLTLDSSTGKLLGLPKIYSKGFVFQRDSEALFRDARDIIRQAVEDDEDLREVEVRVEKALARFYKSRIRRKPVIFVFTSENGT